MSEEETTDKIASPRLDATISSEVRGFGRTSLSGLFVYQGQMLDAAMRQTMAVTGFNAAFMRGFLGLNPWFRAWQKQVDELFTQWEMPSTAGVYYDYSKNVLDQQLQFLPPVMREWVKYQLMFNPHMQEMMHGEGVIAVLEYIGNLLPGEGTLYGEEYNHHLLTEDSHGNIRPVSAEEIDNLFPRTGLGEKQKAFPRIVLTSSHARGEKLSDVTDITHGIEALARDSFRDDDHPDGVPLKITHVNGKISDAPNNTLILMACDTERNPFLNAAALLRRLSDLKRIEHTGEADDFKNTSPGAKRLAKLMLRCMAQNPDDVKIDDLRPLSEIGNSIALRARPELIAQHFQLIGYSKGGNVVSDAMRYLINDLTAKNGDESLVMVQGKEATKDNVRNLVRNIACMSIAALEVPMADHYKEHGVRRVSFNNKYDTISNHMDFEPSWADRKWKISGAKQNQGHDPKDAMGTRDGKKGYILEEKDDDERKVVRRLRESFAPLHGKATISSISFTDDDFTRDGTRLKDGILIGTAAGTSDELFGEHVPHILDMLRTAFRKVFANASGVEAQKMDAGKVTILEANQSNRRAFVLKGPEGWRENPKALQAMHDGLLELRREKNSGIVISDEIFERIIPERVKHMKQKPDAPHTWKSFKLDTGIQRAA